MKWSIGLICCFGLLFIVAPPAGAQTPPTRGLKEIATEMDASTAQVHDLLSDDANLTDPAKRAAIAPTIIPILYRITTDLQDWGNLRPEAKEEADDSQEYFLMLRALFGDKRSVDQLHQLANSPDVQKSLPAKTDELSIQWLSSSHDQAVQTKTADQLEALAKAHPDSDHVTKELYMLASTGAATPELANRMFDLIVNTMKGAEADEARQHILQVRKLKAMENKPLVITGTTAEGKPFTTADWKGKVIVVDFWATWCPLCVAELPALKKLYADNHAKGMEVVGISNDYTADALNHYLETNKDMTWPQLVNNATGEQSMNPIAQGFGIEQLPTMFIIDKHGVLRSSDADQSVAALIPKLLAE